MSACGGQPQALRLIEQFHGLFRDPTQSAALVGLLLCHGALSLHGGPAKSAVGPVSSFPRVVAAAKGRSTRRLGTFGPE